jgi:hypothetical protein
MPIISQSDVNQNLASCFAFWFNLTDGATTMTLETLERFAEAGSLLMPVLAEYPKAGDNIPDWLPLGMKGDIFIPRAHLCCFIVNQKGYDEVCSSLPLAEVTPWREGDGDAYVIITNITSQVRNGVAKLVVSFGERIEKHLAFPHVKEVMWYTRTAKGVAMSQYFQGHETGRQITRTFANGKTQSMPIYTLKVEDWRKHTEGVIAKLIDIEANFSDTLAEAHKKIKEGL